MMVRDTLVTWAGAVAAMMLTLAAGPGPVQAGIIPVANGSFESPDAGASPFFALPEIDAWVRSGPTYSIPELGQSGMLDTGVFLNQPVDDPTHIDGVDGRQMAFIGAQDPSNLEPGQPPIGLHQSLSRPYEQGMLYRLTIGVAPASALAGRDPRTDNPHDPDPDAPPAVLRFRLAWEQDGQRLEVAAAEVLSTQLEQNRVLDFELSTPLVKASDPWLDEPIVIDIMPAHGLSGFWNVDHVRVVQIPEPSSAAALLALLATGLLRRARLRQPD